MVGGFVRDMLLAGHGGEFGSVIPGKGERYATRGEKLFASLYCHPRESEDPFSRGCSVSSRFHEDAKDIDLVTSDPLNTFLPTVQQLSKRHHIMQHYQAVQLSFEDYQVTLTRLRYDACCDGRQAEVTFVKTLQEDVWRRDFTINALYADMQGQVIDFVGGYEDLARKQVRFIGDPETRIKEDVLRILRYVRFCSLLEVPMDQGMLNVMRPYLSHLQSISPDRLQYEIKKIHKLPLGEKNLEQLMNRHPRVREDL